MSRALVYKRLPCTIRRPAGPTEWRSVDLQRALALPMSHLRAGPQLLGWRACPRARFYGSGIRVRELIQQVIQSELKEIGIEKRVAGGLAAAVDTAER